MSNSFESYLMCYDVMLLLIIYICVWSVDMLNFSIYIYIHTSSLHICIYMECRCVELFSIYCHRISMFFTDFAFVFCYCLFGLTHFMFIIIYYYFYVSYVFYSFVYKTEDI